MTTVAWHRMADRKPEPGYKFVALFDDGSGLGLAALAAARPHRNAADGGSSNEGGGVMRGTNAYGVVQYARDLLATGNTAKVVVDRDALSKLVRLAKKTPEYSRAAQNAATLAPETR